VVIINRERGFMPRMASNRLSSLFKIVPVFIAIASAIWASVGSRWYIYLFNFILLFLAGLVAGTAVVQGITRGWSYIHILGVKGISKVVLVNILTIFNLAIAYILTYFVFQKPIQFIAFFSSIFALYLMESISNDQFRLAIEKTKIFEMKSPKF
jgi:hypothetical protein